MRKSLSIAASIAALFIMTSTAMADTALSTRESLVKFNDTFNQYAASHDVEAMMSLYDQDAYWIAPKTPPAKGRDGVPRQTFSFLSENKGHLSHTIDELFISDDGTQAVMMGEAIVLVEKANLDIKGTYIFTLEREGDKWEIATDMFNHHSK